MEKQVVDLYKQGSEAFNRSDYAEAHECLHQILDKGLKFADVYNMLGVIAFENDHFEAAVKNFREALEINPNYTEARLNMAVVLNDTGDYSEGEEAYQQAREASHIEEGTVDPFIKGRLANLHSELAEIYHGLGLYDDAMQEYKVAVTLCPTFPDVRTRMGVLYRDMGLHDEAIAEFKEVERVAPGYLQAGIQMGISYYGIGKSDEAVEQWRAVLATDPGNPKALMYLKLVEKENSQGA